MKRSLRLHNYLKTLLFLAFFGFNVQASFGQLLVEDFNSTNTGNLSTQNSWVQNGLGTDAQIANAAPISFTSYNGGSGNYISLSNSNGIDPHKLFSSPISTSSPSVIFYSFLVNVSAGSAISEYCISLRNSANTAYLGRVFVNVNSGNVKFGISVGSSAVSSVAASNYNLNQTYLLVLRYDVGSSTTDSMYLWVNPSTSVEPLISGADASHTNNKPIYGTAINAFMLHQRATTSPVYKLDAIRVSNGTNASNAWNSLGASSATTWTTSWSNGVPDATKDATIDGTYNTNVGGNQIPFTAKKLTVTTNGNLTINSGTNVTVQDDVVNNGLLTVESNANLVQVNNTTNSGTISVKRETNSLMRFDYVMWSTPVDGTQKLLDFSPLTSLTPAVRFYTYDNVNNVYVSVASPSTSEFVNATGYLIRLPFDHPTAPAVWTGTFSGVPNNGPISLTSLTPGQFYATGNPYPSTISADLFMNANGLTDALYFWRKTNGAAGSAYATYTLAGGTSPEPGTTATPTSGIPNGTIQVGQGFIAKANGTSLVYNNLMRATPNNVNQTFRSASAALPTTVEKNRFWLNLSNATETIGQTLVSYMTGATNGLDAQIDGKYINDSATALTSLIAGEEFAIQGKTLPFTASDVVPLGFKAQTAGNYSISLFDKDGLFSSNGQIIYLRDNLTNTVQNLNSGAYNFTSQAGVFNGRFDVVYQNALNTDVVDFTSNNVYIYNQNNVLNINSGTNTMSAVKVYDVLGRLLAQNNKVNASQTQINVPVTNQTLIVQITSSEGIVVVKKVAN